MSARERLAAQDAQLERLGAGVDRIRNLGGDDARHETSANNWASSTSWKETSTRRRPASAKKPNTRKTSP